MRSPLCKCEHEKRDHRRTAYGPAGGNTWGECKICLCKRYVRVVAPDVNVSFTEVRSPAPVPLID